MTSVRFSPDGMNIASGSNDKTIIIWDIETGKQVKKIEGHADGITSIRFSPDGNNIASAS